MYNVNYIWIKSLWKKFTIRFNKIFRVGVGKTLKESKIKYTILLQPLNTGGTVEYRLCIVQIIDIPTQSHPNLVLCIQCVRDVWIIM